MLLDATAHALTHRLAAEQSRGRAPSLVGGVVRDGALVWSGARGLVGNTPPHDDTQYRIGSITKTFVAVLVLRLREEGLLSLDDELGRHLPDAPAADATIAQLLAHSSGLAAETGAPWWERSDGSVRPDLASLVAVPPLRAPGRRHHYSNVGFGLLGALVGHLRGVDWTVAMQDEILDPLGMPRTTYRPVAPHAEGFAVHPWADVLLPEPAEDAGLMAPAGQLWSTIDDLARYGTFLLRGDDRVLPRAVVEEMRVPSAPAEAGEPLRSQGLGLQLMRHQTRDLAGHTGSMPGFVATLWIDPAADLAAVACANVTSGPAISVLVADLIATVADREPRLPAPWAPAAVDPELLALLGPWYWGASPVAFAAARVRRAAPRRARRRRPDLAVPAAGRRDLARPRRLLRGGDAAGGAHARRRRQPPRPRQLRVHPRALRARRGGPRRRRSGRVAFGLTPSCVPYRRAVLLSCPGTETHTRPEVGRTRPEVERVRGAADGKAMTSSSSS